MLMRFRQFLVCGAVRLWVYQGGNLGGKTGTITASLWNFRLIILKTWHRELFSRKCCPLISLTLNVWWGFIDSFAVFFSFFSSKSWARLTKQLPSQRTALLEKFHFFFFYQKEDVWRMCFCILWKLWVFDPSHLLPFNLTRKFLFPLRSRVVCIFTTTRIVQNLNITIKNW